MEQKLPASHYPQSTNRPLPPINTSALGKKTCLGNRYVHSHLRNPHSIQTSKQDYSRLAAKIPFYTLMSHSINALTPSATSKSSTDWDDGVSMESASPAGTTASSGTKRKRNTDPKFYAVRVGNHPGIYHSWKDCLEQVKGFKNATC